MDDLERNETRHVFQIDADVGEVFLSGRHVHFIGTISDDYQKLMALTTQPADVMNLPLYFSKRVSKAGEDEDDGDEPKKLPIQVSRYAADRKPTKAWNAYVRIPDLAEISC